MDTTLLAAQDEAGTEELVSRFSESMDSIRRQVQLIIVGQDEVIDNLLMTLLVGGHCLITGMPGTAKTLLVSTLASALGLTFKRIQFTPDLMPTDITGRTSSRRTRPRVDAAGRSSAVRCSPTSCWPMRSTGRRPRRRLRC